VQDGWCGHPRRARLSAVRSLFLDEHPNKEFAFVHCSSPSNEADLVANVGTRIGLCRLNWRSLRCVTL
jgi:hypothetical protein